MGLIENSKDLLNVVIAFCVLWLTIFIAWFIYYLAMIARQFYTISKEMGERMKKIDEAIKNFKEKMEHSAMYLSLIGDGVKKIIEMVRERKGKKK
jgi:predicted PurR-regulated permease PerM